MVKRYFFHLIILAFPLSAIDVHLDPTPYKQEASAWIHTHFKNYSDPEHTSDLVCIANLFYFSFLRSAANLDASDIAYQAFITSWQGWQNIAQTRMNPSLSVPFDVDFSKNEQLFKDFLHAQYYHRMIGLTYAHCTQLLIKENYLSPSMLAAIKELRAQARTIVIIALTDVKKVLGGLYNFASAHARLGDADCDEEVRFDLLEKISAHIPYFAMQSFIEAERINKKANEHTWEVLITLIDVNKQIWEAIETARASYYLAHYQALWEFIKEKNIDQSTIKIMFNENGILQSDAEYLPEL